MKKIKNNALIIKANDLVEARYKLSLNEQKLILTMISMIEPNDEDFKPYQINIVEFADLLGIVDDNAYTKIKELSRGLMEKVLQIKESNRLLQINWFSSADYYDNKGFVELCFDPKLKPYLLQLKEKYVKYNLGCAIKLRSIYSIRIYELLKQYEKIGSRSFELEELRNILGIKPEEYEQYNDFKRKVLLTAQEEIKEKTDISFNFKVIKTSRKVTGIEFKIRSKPKQIETANKKETILPEDKAAKTAQDEKSLNALWALLNKNHQEKKTIRNIVEEAYRKHGYEYVKWNILYANSKSSGNYRAFLIKSIESNWGLCFKEDAIISDNVTDKIKQEEEIIKQKEKNERIEKYISELPNPDYEEIKKEAIEKMPPDIKKFKEGHYLFDAALRRNMEKVASEKMSKFC